MLSEKMCSELGIKTGDKITLNVDGKKAEAWGHRCLVIGGKNVQNYVENHYSGQKTDLNDAQALAFLAQDTQLRTIKAKDMEQQKYASLTTLREQYIKQYRQTIVSLKGICQGIQAS